MNFLKRPLLVIASLVIMLLNDAWAQKILSVKIEGNQSLDIGQFETKIAPFLDKQVTQERLENLRMSIFDRYLQSGVLARVELPPQDLSSGRITVEVIELPLGEVVVQAPSNFRFSSERVKQYFAPLHNDKAVSVTGVEQRAEFLEAVPGITAQAKVQPAADANSIDLLVEVDNTELFNGTVQIDNLGSASTGRSRLNADMEINSPLFLGEKWVLGLIKARDLQTNSVDLELPFGVHGKTLAFGVEDTRYEIPSNSDQIKGGSVSHQLSLRGDSTTFNARYEWTYSITRYVDDLVSSGIKTRITDKELTASNISLTHSYVSNDKTASLNQVFGARYGKADLSRLPSVEQADRSGANIQGDFFTLRYDLAAQKRLSLNDSLAINLTCQLANKNLDSSQKLGLAGPTSVRAFDGGAVSVDRGCYSQAEWLYSLTDRQTVFAGVDLGHGETNVVLYDGWRSGNEHNHKSIAGAVIGARLTLAESLSGSLTYAHRLDRCHGCNSEHDHGRFWGVLTWSY